jgi:hypothetical protein
VYKKLPVSTPQKMKTKGKIIEKAFCMEKMWENFPKFTLSFSSYAKSKIRQISVDYNKSEF